jgi:DNA-binding protein HU-beta
MNKSDLIAAVAEAAGISKSDAASAVDATFVTIADALKDGVDIRLTGFGSFGVADRAAREGRNPRTGEPIKIAASRQAKFKAGKGLKDAVRS